MMDRKSFEETLYKMSYDEYRACYCPSCCRSNCIHRDAYRRVPKIDSGLGLCPNLKFVSIIEDHGVLVQINDEIKDYRSASHAIEALENTDENYDNVINQLKRGKVFCSDEWS